MAKCIVFDCDGTLVDTETLCADVDLDILAGHGIHFESAEVFLNEFIGRAHQDILNDLNARHGTNIDFKIWAREFTDRTYARIQGDMNFFPESVTYIEGLAARGFVMAVASNGYRKLVNHELDVAGYRPFIPASLTFGLEDAQKPKPAPDLYLMAAAKAGYAPADCVVVEDSPAGARAGVAAGMNVIGYTGFSHDPAQAAESLKTAGCTAIIHNLSALEAHIS